MWDCYKSNISKVVDELISCLTPSGTDCTFHNCMYLGRM